MPRRLAFAVLGVLFAALAAAPAASALSFRNPAPIGVYSANLGNPDPVPSRIRVKGLKGNVSKATVTLSRLSYAATGGMGALLVGPGGQSTVLMANVCSGEASGLTLTFDDGAPGSLPESGPCASGRYRPTYLNAHGWFPPAPEPPYGTTLGSFKTVAPNGVWTLYVDADTVMGSPIAGSISNGWTLRLAGPKTGRRAAALAKCKAKPAGKRKKCRAKARKLPP